MSRAPVMALVLLFTASFASASDLSTAVYENDLKKAKALLEAGADVNEDTGNGYRAIYGAESLEMLELLLKHGAKHDVFTNGPSRTPLEYFAEKSFRRPQKTKIYQPMIARLREAGAAYTIAAAIYLNDFAFVKDQVTKDPNRAKWNRQDRTESPLRFATRAGRVEICKLLLDHKADPDEFEAGGGYPILMYAVSYPEIVKLLVERGANLRRRITWMGGRSGVWIIGDEATALHYAVSAGSLESVKVLLAAGLDPSAADDRGQTPLHIALEMESFNRSQQRKAQALASIVECLLAADASIRMTNRDDQTPLKLAKALKSPKAIIRLLEKRDKEFWDRYNQITFPKE